MTADLVLRAQRGDHEAFEALVRPHANRLTSVASRILRDPYAAEDAVQDAIVGAWRDLRTLRDPDRFDAWLYRGLVNACRNELRRRKRRPVEVAVMSIDPSSDEDIASGLARRDELARAFERLSVEHRAVLVFTHYLGYSALEVGAILGIPAGTVASRLHYGIAAMRRILDRNLRATVDLESAP